MSSSQRHTDLQLIKLSYCSLQLGRLWDCPAKECQKEHICFGPLLADLREVSRKWCLLSWGVKESRGNSMIRSLHRFYLGRGKSRMRLKQYLVKKQPLFIQAGQGVFGHFLAVCTMFMVLSVFRQWSCFFPDSSWSQSSLV